VLAAGMFELLVKIFVLVGIFIIMFFLGIEIVIADPLLMMYCFFTLWWLSLMLGLLFSILMAYVPEVSKLLSLVTRPLFFISGIFFSLQDFPKEYWHFLNWNPILHAIELTRYAAYPAYGNEGVSLSFLSMVTLITTFLSLSIYYTNWRQAISR
jgi:capsular polysaccharide transport system permease protein